MSDNEWNGDDLINSVIDTEKLIMEMEKRPALYNKELKEYSDRNLKEKLWGEICANVFGNWNELTEAEKKSKGKEIQKKWKNLKDCFARELAAQRKLSTGQGAKKRRRYVHFDSLLFLLPFIQGRETSSNISHIDSHERNENQECFDKTQDGQNMNTRETERPAKRKKENLTSYEASLLNILKSKREEEISEDKNFALMLVPMLEKLNDEQKHYAKIEILNVMRNARLFNPQPFQPTNLPTFSPPTLHQPLYNQHPQVSQCNYGNVIQMPQTERPIQMLYADFAQSIASPASTSDSELFDMSKH